MAFPLDRRTRRNADIRAVTPGPFFAEDLPALVDRHGPLVSAAAAVLDAPPLGVRVGDDSWTIDTGPAGVTVRPGVGPGAVVLRLSPEQFSDWAQDVRSLHSFAVARDLRSTGASQRDISVWDSLWRCLLDGWPVVGDIDFLDREGQPLDFDRVFTPDDDPVDVAHFVREAGFVHLRGFVSPRAAAAISHEVDAALPSYTEGDGRSWWAELGDGTRRCVRMQEFVDHSPAMREVLESDGWAALLAAVAGDDEIVQGRPGKRVTEALVKPVGVVAGASDLSFHRDCHLGRHAYGCSGVDVGLTVTPSGRGNGRLGVVAGSHRLAIPVDVATSDPYLPIVGITTEAGDCTVHLSCTLHESTAPVVAPRKVLYTPYKLAPLDDDVSPIPGDDTHRDRVYKILLGTDADAAPRASTTTSVDD
jgi:hypothetical protein